SRVDSQRTCRHRCSRQSVSSRLGHESAHKWNGALDGPLRWVTNDYPCQPLSNEYSSSRSVYGSSGCEIGFALGAWQQDLPTPLSLPPATMASVLMSMVMNVSVAVFII